MEGDYPAAHAGYRRAFLLREEIGELRFRAYNLATLADLQNLEGDMAAALQSAQQAVQLCESFGDQLGLALARISLGRVQAALGQDETAHDLFKDALMTGRQSGDLRLTVEPLTEWGRLELAHGDVATAKTNFDAALAAFAKLNELHSNLIVGAWLGLGGAGRPGMGHGATTLRADRDRHGRGGLADAGRGRGLGRSLCWAAADAGRGRASGIGRQLSSYCRVHSPPCRRDRGTPGFENNGRTDSRLAGIAGDLPVQVGLTWVQEFPRDQALEPSQSG